MRGNESMLIRTKKVRY